MMDAMELAQAATVRADELKRDPRVLHKKHPLAIRWFHWINFPVLFVMIWSGLMIYWANTAYHFPVIEYTHWPISDHGRHLLPYQLKVVPLELFPDTWFHPKASSWVPNWLATTPDPTTPKDRILWSMDQRLAEGMAWHFTFAWLFTINGLIYVLFLAISGQWRKIVPKPKALLESIMVVLVDLHLSKRKLPVRKYNAAQQIAYTGVIVMGALMVLTGISIYKPMEQSWLTRIFFGYTAARFIHFWTTMAFLAFFVVHVGQVIRTGWNNFRGMVTGHELVTPEEKEVLEAQP